MKMHALFPLTTSYWFRKFQCCCRYFSNAKSTNWI